MSFLSDTSYEIGHFDLQDILSLIQKSTYGQPHRDAPGNSCIPAVNPYMAAFPYILQVKLIITTGKAVRFERSDIFCRSREPRRGTDRKICPGYQAVDNSTAGQYPYARSEGQFPGTRQVDVSFL